MAWGVPGVPGCVRAAGLEAVGRASCARAHPSIVSAPTPCSPCLQIKALALLLVSGGDVVEAKRGFWLTGWLLLLVYPKLGTVWRE